MKHKNKKTVKKQMLSLKGKIEKYLTKEDYYDLFNKAKASLNISKLDYKGTYILATLIEKNFITATELDFSSSYEYRKVDLVNLETLIESLEKNTSLTKINFSKNNICERGLTYFASIIAKNRTITSLDLSLNNNGFISSKESPLDGFEVSLQSNKTLIALNLSYNRLRKAGTEKIVKGLKYNFSIKDLNLSVNIIGDEGAECIKDLISKNKTLTKLDISGNAFTDTGISKIAEGLPKNKALTTLDLSLNHITDQGVETIINSLELNTTLTKLDLSYNEIGNKGAGFILLFIKEHPTINIEIAHNKNISEFFINTITLINNSNKKLKVSPEIVQTKTVIREDKEKYKLKTQGKFLETIKEEGEEEELTSQIVTNKDREEGEITFHKGRNKEEGEEEEVTFHIGTNKNIFSTDSELHLELTGSYDSELPDLMQ